MQNTSFWRMPWRLRRFQCERPILHECQTSISFVRSATWGLRGKRACSPFGKLLSTYEVRVTDAEGGLVAVATITGYGVGARPLGGPGVCGFRIGCFRCGGVLKEGGRVPCLSPPCGFILGIILLAVGWGISRVCAVFFSALARGRRGDGAVRGRSGH